MIQLIHPHACGGVPAGNGPAQDVLLGEALPDEAVQAKPVSDDLLEDLVENLVERAVLWVEFEAIIAAGYRPAADAPHPNPPARRLGTGVALGRPIPPPRSSDGNRRPPRPRPCAVTAAAPRERGPPAPPRH